MKIFTAFVKVASVIACFLFPIISFSQLATLWTKPTGCGNLSETFDMTTDGSGNIYTTGHFYSGDFDPGTGTYYMSRTGTQYRDIFVCKWDADGNFIWAKQLGGGDDERGTGIAADGSGNVFITGYLWSQADFDPGPGVYNLSPAALLSVFVCKLNSNGDFVWAKLIDGPIDMAEPTDIAVDPLSGAVIFTGHFRETFDFDPDPATSYNMTAAGVATGDWEAFICKLDASGSFMWAKQMGVAVTGVNTFNSFNSAAVDGNGNIFTARSFSDNSNSGGFIHKLDASGNFSWGTQIGDGASVAVDGNGVYTIGYSQTIGGYVVEKLNSSGSYTWSGQGGAGPAIAVDVNGNIIAGDKLLPSGNVVCNGYGGIATRTNGIDIFTLANESVIKWRCPTVVLSAAATPSYFCKGGCATITGTPSGGTLPYTYSWSPGGQTTQAITVCPTVTSTYTVTVKDAYNNTATEAKAITVHPLPANASISPSSTTICNGKNATLTASGGNAYSWSPGGATTAVITVSPISTATYTVAVANGFGCTKTATSTVNVNPPPNVAVSGNTTICQGNTATLIASGGGTYVWNTGITSPSITVAPTSTTSYTVTVTGTNGCVKSAGITVKVDSVLSLFMGDDKNICRGDSVELFLSGWTNYLWNTGATTSSIIIAPTSSSTFSVLVTNGSCSATASSVINVYNNPVLNITSMPASCSTCSDGSAAALATGNAPFVYQWSPSGQNTSIATGLVTGSHTICVTDIKGCMNCSPVIVNFVTGVQNISINQSVLISPNPTNGKFTIERSGEQSTLDNLEIYNMLGEKIFHSTFNNRQLIIDISGQPGGIYLYQIRTNNKIAATGKIVIQ